MGLFSSRSNSSSVNNQTTNNTSISTALNQTGSGTAIWGNGNMIVSHDGGAMDAASQMARDSLNAAESIAGVGAGMVTDLFDKSATLAGDFAKQNSSLANYAVGMIASQSDKFATMSGRAFDLSQAFAEDSAKMAREAMTYGGDLAREFSQSAFDISKQAQQTAVDASRYALQFADNASRSDGQQYALEANKNQMFTTLGIAALVIVALFLRSKK